MKACGATALALGAGLALGMAVAPQLAIAQAVDKTLTLSATTSYDDNLFRNSDAIKDQLPHDGSDIITYLGANGTLHRTVSQFDVSLNAAAGERLFAYNSDLNVFEYQGSAVGSYVQRSGQLTLSASYSHLNSTFNDPLFRGNNVQNLLRLGADGSRAFLGDIRLAGAFQYRSNANSDRNIRRADNHTYTYSGGLEYVSPLGNLVEVGYEEERSSGSDFYRVVIDGSPILYTTDYTNRSTFVEVKWVPDVVWSVDGRVGYTWHDDRSALDSDFSGVTFDGSVAWTPTDSTTGSVRFNRGFSSNNEIFSNGVTVTSVGVGLNTALFGRIAGNAAVTYAKYKYRYDLSADDPTDLARRERYWVFALGATYMTAIGIGVHLEGSYADISSTINQLNATEKVVSLSLTKQFNF